MALLQVVTYSLPHLRNTETFQVAFKDLGGSTIEKMHKAFPNLPKNENSPWKDQQLGFELKGTIVFDPVDFPDEYFAWKVI